MRVVRGFYDSVKVEERISNWWNQNRIFQKLVESKKGKKQWSDYDHAHPHPLGER